jgi:RimJ/RimL family protein N-acetyltransferase
MTRLRAPQLGDAAVLDRQNDGPAESGEFSWFGFRRSDHFAERITSSAVMREDGGMLTVVGDADDDVLGDVSWHRVLNGPPPNGHCWNVGVWIAPDARGKGHGSEAQRLLVAYLFEHTFLERVEASTETGNLAEQRALEKAGFTREGVLRRACFRGGAWRDMVIFSKLRGEA